MSGLAELIARARQRDPEAGAALADLVEGAVATPGRRIGAVFRIKRRGGDPRAEHRGRRNETICVQFGEAEDIQGRLYTLLTDKSASAFHPGSGAPHGGRYVVVGF